MKLAHLSDLHFGTETPGVVRSLQNALAEIGPDLIVISGDFTQVASSAEFKTARAFIDGLIAPVFCVPGNHDIPRYALRERFFNPYKKYRRYIQDDLWPVFEKNNVILAGINSARRILPHWNWANGAVSRGQLNHLKSVYEKSPAVRRICVFHHPIHEALNAPMDTVVFGAREALRMLNALEVDLVLTGHVHHASITTLGDIKHRTVYLSASTALSSRLRDQENGFNIVEIGEEELNIRLYTLEAGTFSLKENYFHRF